MLVKLKVCLSYQCFDHKSLYWHARFSFYFYFLLSQFPVALRYINSEKVKTFVSQSFPNLCDPMYCSPPGFFVHGIFQARILEWVAIPFARESSWPRDQTQVSCNAGRFFTIGATREAQSFALPSLRFKFRTFRLWDWHAACCAKEATLSRDPINCKFY